jgi:hypothetical protein
MNDKLEKAKQIIDQYYARAPHGIFDCKGWAGDDMYTIYSSDGLVIDICYDYEYFEVFGLSEDEFIELETYYNNKE